ncbi:MAG: DUF5724 domain-containing protein [Phycisphaerales bacterium JB039]
MPSHEEIESQLKTFYQRKWLDARLSRLARWPGRRRETLRQLLQTPTDWMGDGPQPERLLKTIRYFQELGDADRRKLWAELFPKLADLLECAWQDAPQRPYQFEWGRLPFRSPSNPAVQAASRARFFLQITQTLRNLDEDVHWLAAWAAHLPTFGDDVGWVLAAALRAGGAQAEAVRQTLIASINGEHEIGQMGRHAIVALLNSGDRQDWEYVGKLLLAAQRQEGLRQAILEAVDEGHPDAFRYMLGLILEHDLARFSATVRAFDVWLGTQWAGGSVKVVNSGIRRMTQYLDDPTLREQMVRDGEPEDAYIALWAAAFQDAHNAIALATPLLADPTPERRFIAVLTLDRLLLVPDAIEPLAQRLVADEETDDRVLAAMLEAIARPEWSAVPQELFAAIAKLYERLPAKGRKCEAIVWPWCEYTLSRRDAAAALRSMATAAPERMIPYAGALESWACVTVIRDLAGTGWGRRRKRSKLTPEGRALMLELITDSRADVYEAAFEALESLPVEEDEVERICGALHRSAAKLRRCAIGRLTKLAPDRIVRLADELMADGAIKKRAAGLELAAHLVEKDLAADEARNLVEKHRQQLTDPELAEQVERLVGTQVDASASQECLGLLDPKMRARPIAPKFVGVSKDTKAARACLRSLAELFLQRGEEQITYTADWVEPGEGAAKRTGLLAENLPGPRRGASASKEDLEQALENLPLREAWHEWIAGRPASMRDKDGLELVRAWMLTEFGDEHWLKEMPAALRSQRAYGVLWSFRRLAEWLPLLCGAGALEFVVQVPEDRLAQIKAGKEPATLPENSRRVSESKLRREFDIADQYLAMVPGARADDALVARLGALRLLAMDLGVTDCERGPPLEQFSAAYKQGLATEHDFYAWMLKERVRKTQWDDLVFLGSIDDVTRLRPHPALRDLPPLLDAARRMRERIIEVELTRGERLGPASEMARQIHHAGGAATLFRLAAALGRDNLVRQDQWTKPTRAYSFSRLITVTAPEPEDTPQRFAELFKTSGVAEKRLLDLALFAPQWATHIEHTLAFEGLEDAVWWIHAHTKQMSYWRDQEFREMWAARISERTELEAEDLEDGAVDVAWFHRMLGGVGMESWRRLLKSARYASNSGGHKRAELFASAMLSEVKPADLIKRMDATRHQESVRALGLIPLPQKPADARAETLSRYQRLQEFRRQSRKFGSQRQASEGRAVDIGLQNLARTAGYRDPRRLEWAMEAEAVADLAQGPVTINADDTTISLAIDAEGAPELTITKKDKPLKNVPAKLRKREDIAQLRSRVTDLRRQRTRMRLSLETSMCRADAFTGPELRELWDHPLLRPMLQRLVFIGDGDLIGYPIEGARALQHCSGAIEPIGKQETVRLAHPIDLLARGDWGDWQRDCFSAERIQPIKQIFREVYPKTDTEIDQADSTRRYAGHQVNPRQALALLKQRQWVIAPEEGVRRTYHDEGITANLWFAETYFTPADVDGLTLEAVSFQRRTKARGLMHIADVPDRVFSETMRDLDLVVSVAHAGGVDPEATASTVEMRSALLDQTCKLLGLANVRIDGVHAFIDGARASYSLHLGSAITHVLPGRALPIVAVHSQYRGRLFLPFADDDPRTAEVMAKALLLARDDEIRDPAILEHIRG